MPYYRRNAPRALSTLPPSLPSSLPPEYAASRKLCADPSRIKLMYDGESLAASGDQTPEDMGLEDRDMIDVKLPKT